MRSPRPPKKQAAASTGEDSDSRESCTSPATGPRPRGPGPGPLGAGRACSRAQATTRDRSSARGVRDVNPSASSGQPRSRDTGSRADRRCSCPRMSAPGSGHRDRAAPRSAARALPYLPLGPQQAQKLPAPAQQHPRHLDRKRTSARTCALGTAAPRAAALLETGGSRGGRGGEGARRPCWKWARRRGGPPSWGGTFRAATQVREEFLPSRNP